MAVWHKLPASLRRALCETATFPESLATQGFPGHASREATIFSGSKGGGFA